MIAVFTAPARIRKPTTTTKAFRSSRARRRPDHVHRQPADEVARVVLHADLVGDQHHGQEGNAGRQHQAVDEDDEGRLLEVRQLRRFDLAVDLGQRLLAAHGQDRMPEGEQQADHADDAHPVARLAQLLANPGHKRLMNPSGSSCCPVASLSRGTGRRWPSRSGTILTTS